MEKEKKKPFKFYQLKFGLWVRGPTVCLDCPSLALKDSSPRNASGSGKLEQFVVDELDLQCMYS